MATKEAVEWFKGLSSRQKKDVAERAGIKIGTLRNIFYSGRKTSPETVCKIERATNYKIKRYQIMPEYDWSLF